MGVSRWSLEISETNFVPVSFGQREGVSNEISIVINNPDRRPWLDRGLSRASCKANTIYHPFKREARIGGPLFSEVSTWRMACARWKQKSVRYVSRTTHKTRFKLMSRYFVYSRMHLDASLKNCILAREFLVENRKLAADFAFNLASFYVISSRIYWIKEILWSTVY